MISEAAMPPMPSIGLGTWELSGDRCYRAVRSALDLGYRHIDTARRYGNEPQVGQAIADSRIDREQIWVTTKLWHTELAPDDVLESTDLSLASLQLDYLDLLMIHWPSHEAPLEQTLKAMSSLVANGKVRHLGVSNFTVSGLKRATRLAQVYSHQIEYHPYLAQSDLLDEAARQGVILTAAVPLAKGRVLSDPIIADVASVHGITPAQAVLAWLRSQEIVAIPRSGSAEHLRENLESLRFELNHEALEKLSSLSSGLRFTDPPWAPWNVGRQKADESRP